MEVGVQFMDHRQARLFHLNEKNIEEVSITKDKFEFSRTNLKHVSKNYSAIDHLYYSFSPPVYNRISLCNMT